MKVEIMRASGLPLQPDQVEKYMEDWRLLFDKCKAHTERKNRTNTLPKLLDRVERQLRSKYEQIRVIDYPTSHRAMLKLWKEYGNLMVAKRADSEKLLLVIIDQDVS
jgi:hypothetical protein